MTEGGDEDQGAEQRMDWTYHVTKRFREDVIDGIKILSENSHDTSERYGVEEGTGSEKDSMNGVLVKVPRRVEVEEGHGESENEGHECLGHSESRVDRHLTNEKANRGQRGSSRAETRKREEGN